MARRVGSVVFLGAVAAVGAVSAVPPLACTANSTMAPSWCAFQNPLIVPRPPTPLLKSPTPFAEYVPDYICGGG